MSWVRSHDVRRSATLYTILSVLMTLSVGKTTLAGKTGSGSIHGLRSMTLPWEGGGGCEAPTEEYGAGRSCHWVSRLVWFT